MELQTLNNNKTQCQTRSEDVKSRIISAALNEFAQYGVESARIKRIADNAGISKSNIFYYFKTKQNLYRAVIREFLRRINSQLDLRLSRCGTFEQMLREIIYTHSTIINKSNYLVQILRRELANSQNEIIQDISDTILSSESRKVLKLKYEQEVSAGRFRDLDFDQTMLSFYLMSLGYLSLAPLADVIWQIEDVDEFLSQRKFAIIDLFLNGILNR